MSNLDKKVIAYLGRTPDFLEEVKLQNDGQGTYIKEWNVDGVAKPTDAQLNALSSQATTLENNAIAVANRQKEYGTTIQQLEYIVEHGVSAFIEKQNSIKTKFPKEGE